MAASSDASAAMKAPDDELQSKLIFVAPATTPEIRFALGTSCPPPVTVTVHGNGDAAFGLCTAADAAPALVSATPATMASDAPIANSDGQRFLV
jgi:hypothetical protein